MTGKINDCCLPVTPNAGTTTTMTTTTANGNNFCETKCSQPTSLILDDIENGFNLMKIEPKWNKARIHTPSDAPLCKTCEQLGSNYFSINCFSCREIIEDKETTISQIFAIMRQWIPQTQQCIDVLAIEILKRGANINDKDGLSDMTLLHYACKAGSSGVGDIKSSLKTVHLLVSNNADVTIKCRWTDMAAIHYAVYFDVAEIVDYLLTVDPEKQFIDEPCRDFDGGTPLHIAASNLCLESAKVLLSHGANVLLKDDLGRTALDCVPEPSNNAFVLPNNYEVISDLKSLLEAATLACIPGESFTYQEPVTGKVVLQALGLTLGDKIVINGSKMGTLKYCGTTQFAAGIWAGVELDEQDGKHDGTYQDVTYFRCKPNHGIFAPISKISKLDCLYWKNYRTTQSRNVNYPKIDVSHVTPKVITGLTANKKQTNNSDITIGSYVALNDRRRGIVRFVGNTEFASGIWYGIEFDKPIGRNDGTINGVKYFSCKKNHGLFAMSSRISRVIRQKIDDNSFDEVDSSDCSLSLSRCSSDYQKSPSIIKRSSFRMSNKKSKISPKSNYEKSQNGSWLVVGMNVFINNDIGVVKYIGEVEFAEGIWLGIELRKPDGKNDGSVKNKRYFTCKPNHGLFVQPKKVSVRGINGAKLLKTT